MSLSRIVVTGANGQVGATLCALLGDKAIPLTREQIDLSKPETIPEILERLNPDAVINPAAYTAVDKAEEESMLAHVINADAVHAFALWCAAKQIPFVHFSTDYVFDG